MDPSKKENLASISKLLHRILDIMYNKMSLPCDATGLSFVYYNITYDMTFFGFFHSRIICKANRCVTVYVLYYVPIFSRDNNKSNNL